MIHQITAVFSVDTLYNISASFLSRCLLSSQINLTLTPMMSKFGFCLCADMDLFDLVFEIYIAFYFYCSTLLLEFYARFTGLGSTGFCLIISSLLTDMRKGWG